MCPSVAYWRSSFTRGKNNASSPPRCFCEHIAFGVKDTGILWKLIFKQFSEDLNKFDFNLSTFLFLYIHIRMGVSLVGFFPPIDYHKHSLCSRTECLWCFEFSFFIPFQVHYGRRRVLPDFSSNSFEVFRNSQQQPTCIRWRISQLLNFYHLHYIGTRYFLDCWLVFTVELSIMLSCGFINILLNNNFCWFCCSVDPQK